MKSEFDVQLTEKDLYRFNIYQTYRGSQGLLSIIIAIIIWVLAGTMFAGGQIPKAILYVAGGIFVLVYIPISLKLRVMKTMRTNEVISGVLHYLITEESVTVSQGDESGELPWDMIYKVVADNKWVLIYSNRINAYIIPRDQMGDQYEAFAQLAKNSLEKFRLKIK